MPSLLLKNDTQALGTQGPETQALGTQALVIQGLYKSFGKAPRSTQAVNNVSFCVPMGAIVGLIGPDGAGKTTLMRLMAGLLTPDAGSLQVLGVDVQKDPLTVQASIGYMPQHFGLYEDLTVQENLTLYADLQGLPFNQRPDRYQQLLAMTGLGAFTDRLAGQLSGGMKQKLGLACTLVRPPNLLLLDEPTVGVDPVSRRELWAIVIQLVQEEGMTVLLSTAYLDEAEHCDEVILLHEGQILGQDTPAAFTQHLAGRVWGAKRHQGLRRHLQAELRQQPGILDAVIDGDWVRVLLAEQTAPPALPDGVWQPLPPRFEDAFVLMLHSQPAPQTAPALAPPASPPIEPTPRERPAEVIAVHGLTRRFGAFIAVNAISFSVQRGEIFGLLGANGAGKSTTFRMLCGLLPASGGALSVAGVDLFTAAAKARARIGYMSQKYALYEVLSVLQNLKFFARAYGLKGAHLSQRLAWALAEFDLDQYRDTNSGLLPLGFKQRLAMACALMHEPDILFLDEPTSGVDPIERRAFWARINGLADLGVTIMITTHFMDEAEYCDRLVIMSQGRILAAGTPAVIRAQAQTEAAPNPSMEDAFITLITAPTQPAGAGA
ncbi:MAG: ABC transporter ATP-binding protein [Halothiobacillus sp. 24-54-40]|jgi:ABC-2 type transport system ATP-binding protein|nr:MAG: ABC transporter ATP-binding protein [Halothiobacillus sp. 35-54-62]OYZ88106.1 MAG: ABC transporter ATP-binding protein [Halothiobacillus sp. 24-54-40]OZA81595.1 MAG: ABC transporter ATP-binding protein [Halothiobacillus sp. 39-53-45]